MSFTQNDRVIYNKRKAKVLTGWTTMKGKAKYRIEILDGPAAGTQVETTGDNLEKDASYNMWEEDLTPMYGKSKNTESQCPRCGSYWKETKFESKVWHDCLYCKKTKEEIVKEYKEKGYVPTRTFWD